MQSIRFLTACATLLVWPSLLAAQTQPRFTLVPEVGGFGSTSHDGSIVYGYSFADGSGIRWTEAEGVMPLPIPPGFDSVGLNVCDRTGAIVGGRADGEGVRLAYVWTEENGFAFVPTPSEWESEPYGMTRDGRYMIGRYDSGIDYPGFVYDRLTGEVVTLDSGPRNTAEVLGISTNGRACTGWTQDAEGDYLFSVWTNGSLATFGYGQAAGVSADGKLVAGTRLNEMFESRPVTWTAEGGMVDLLDEEANAHWVDPLRQVVTGLRNNGEAFIVTTAGLQDLKEMFDTEYGFDVEGLDRFFIAAVTRGGSVMVGRARVIETGMYQGFIAILDGDTDGDGLLDSWENNGIPYMRSDGVEDAYVLDFDGDGVGDADPMRKDLFVEVDAMEAPGLAPTESDLARVVSAFDLSPVANPGPATGVQLHLQFSDDVIPTEDFPDGFLQFDIVKSEWFGTDAERMGDAGTVEARLDAKRIAYRYCLFANTRGAGGSSGQAEIGGNDLMVTLGGFGVPGGTPDEKAGTFMHELGHTLGLRHWGPESEGSASELAGPDQHYNFKPNYYSVMNYLWQFPDDWMTPGSWPLASTGVGYAQAEFNTLNESDLDEVAGIIPAELSSLYPYPGFAIPYNVEPDPDQPAFWIDSPVYAGLGIDFDFDGIFGTTGDGVTMDVNRPEGDPEWPASPGTVLPGHDDWPHLDYDFTDSADYADGAHESAEGLEEVTYDQRVAINDALPPACIGDITHDDTVDVIDLLELLAMWGPCTPGIACVHDLDESAEVDVADLLALLAAWGPCE